MAAPSPPNMARPERLDEYFIYLFSRVPRDRSGERAAAICAGLSSRRPTTVAIDAARRRVTNVIDTRTRAFPARCTAAGKKLAACGIRPLY